MEVSNWTIVCVGQWRDGVADTAQVGQALVRAGGARELDQRGSVLVVRCLM